MDAVETKRASAELNSEVTAIRSFQVEVMLVLKLARCECSIYEMYTMFRTSD